MIFENIGMAFRAILANKLRSSLTILGIVIGIASVIAMLAVGKGAQQHITANVERMGSNLLIVLAGSGNRGVVRSAEGQPLTVADAHAIQQAVPSARIAPEVSVRVQAKYNNQNTATTVLGVTSDYFAARNYTMAIGNVFDTDQDTQAEKICILGKTVAEALFGAGDYPIGQTIRINRQPYIVVGVYEEKGATGWQDADDQILVPLRTAQYRITGDDHIRSLYVVVPNPEMSAEIEAEITEVLRHTHRLQAGQDNDFRIRSQIELMETMENISRSFAILLGSIACISLLVGGIGIMNILLVSVTERTKEIGIRKAIGAYERDILSQFLLEAIVLCGMGGIVGVVVGVGVSYLIGIFSPWQPLVSIFSILLSLGVSLSVGIGFGFFPARKAAKMNPVDALRHE